MSVDILSGIQAQMSYDCCPAADQCWCNGSGWVTSDWDSLHQCPYHYVGQPNNESPEWEWDQWIDNMNGNEQFMIVEEPWEEYEKEWAFYAKRLKSLEEDELLPF